MAVVDQKRAFSERLRRIESGKQFEHADVVGYRTQKKYDVRAAARPKKKRSFADRLLVLIAFLSGIVAVLGGRLAYFHLAQMDWMPPAFLDLGVRGMAIFALVIAGILTVIFSLATFGRMQALVLGCLLMHFGEGAIASNAPEVWAGLFSPDYAHEAAERGASFRLTPDAG